MGCRPPPYNFTNSGLGISSVYCREMGYNIPMMKHSHLHKILLSKLNENVLLNLHGITGAIFNLEYSPDGKYLGVAGAQNTFVLYDPLTKRKIACNREAHLECCNGITFITDKLFATFSDDQVTKIWDVRQLKECNHILIGHSGWIKNVECLSGQKRVITSAFDNTILSYDLNQPEMHLYGSHLMTVSDLMRVKLAPITSDFMIISTRGGSVYKIGNIDWDNLSRDFKQYQTYLRQYTNGYGKSRTLDIKNLSLLHKRRNKLSFVHYNFIQEEGDDNVYEMATSLSIHPAEQCVFARQERIKRRNEHDHKVHWSSVYDLRDRPPEARFKMEKEKFENISDDEKCIYVPYNPTMEVTEKIMNTVLSKCKRQHLVDMSEKQKDTAHPPGITTDIPHATQEDLYDSSFFAMEHASSLGMIKENCFHPSGLLMCSPYQNGFRIFSFNKNYDDFFSAVDSQSEIYEFTSQPLYEAKKVFGHSGGTLCVKCHPFHPQIVSGCLMGELNWFDTQF